MADLRDRAERAEARVVEGDREKLALGARLLRAEERAEKAEARVAALEADEAKAATEATALRQRLAALEHDVDGWLDAHGGPRGVTLRQALDAIVNPLKEQVAELVEAYGKDLTGIARQRNAAIERERLAQERVAALEAAIRDALPADHYGHEASDAECNSACGEVVPCTQHRPDMTDEMCDAHPDLDELDTLCVRCVLLAALGGDDE